MGRCRMETKQTAEVGAPGGKGTLLICREAVCELQVYKNTARKERWAFLKNVARIMRWLK